MLTRSGFILKSLRNCLAILSIILISSIAQAQTWQRISLGTDSNHYTFPIYANHDLNSDLTQIRDIIVITHGINRNGDDYFAAGESLLKNLVGLLLKYSYLHLISLGQLIWQRVLMICHYGVHATGPQVSMPR